LFQHTPNKPSSQPLTTFAHLPPFSVGQLLSSLLFLLLVLSIALVLVSGASVALAAPWAPTVTHALHFLTAIPRPWGCGSGSTAC
jgi:hypothetical protein